MRSLKEYIIESDNTVKCPYWAMPMNSVPQGFYPDGLVKFINSEGKYKFAGPKGWIQGYKHSDPNFKYKVFWNESEDYEPLSELKDYCKGTDAYKVIVKPDQYDVDIVHDNLGRYRCELCFTDDMPADIARKLLVEHITCDASYDAGKDCFNRAKDMLDPKNMIMFYKTDEYAYENDDTTIATWYAGDIEKLIEIAGIK